MLVRRTAALIVASALLPVPAHAASYVGAKCSLVPDPTELAADLAAFYVVGGPLVVDPEASSVTVTCHVLADGAEVDRVSATRRRSVGFVVGHSRVGTFSGPVISVCTTISWVSSPSGSYTDCFAG